MDEADDPGSLRFYMRDNVANDVAAPLMEEIFQARRGTLDVPWEDRLTLDLSSNEGSARFGSPNGLATAWMMFHRHAELGFRTPRVTIFAPGEKTCMIWDMVPQGMELLCRLTR